MAWSMTLVCPGVALGDVVSSNTYICGEMQAHSVIDLVEWLANALLELLYLAHTEVEFGCSVTSTVNCRVVDQVDVVPLPIPVMCDLADVTDQDHV